MELLVLGSSSAGNGYILKSDAGDSLLIECGVHVKKVKQALGFKIDQVNAIVSHCHGDHAGHLIGAIQAGITVYASAETLDAKGVRSHHRAKVMEAGKTYHIGSFKVKAFDVNHDVPCFGFLVFHAECGLTLFLTDTFYCDYKFSGLNNIIVECNHDVELLETNSPKFLQDRVMQSHMNLETCKGLLLANNLSSVNNIVLIHLSDNNSDAVRFQRDIKELTGKTVWVAEPGLEIEFNRFPF